jgi:nicotinamidase-related amidase
MAALNEKESIDSAALRGVTTSGCVLIFASAMLSCILLFLNGGVMMALINAVGERGYNWVNDDRITQFLVLFGPVVLLVIQWTMIDYLRTHLQRRPSV